MSFCVNSYLTFSFFILWRHAKLKLPFIKGERVEFLKIPLKRGGSDFSYKKGGVDKIGGYTN